MRRYWDERARENAVWYVDTSTDYDAPDLERFYETGRKIAAIAFEDAPIRPERREVAVEIGCGLGRVCVGLAEHFPEVVGMDVSPEMLARARELTDHPAVRFVLGDGTSLAPLGDASVDLVTSFTVFQHVPDVAVIEGYIAEAGRILRPGGVFAFQWNNLPHPGRWRVRRRIESTMQRVGVPGPWDARHAPEFLGSRVPLARVQAAVERAGMTIEAITNEDTLYCWAWARRS